MPKLKLLDVGGSFGIAIDVMDNVWAWGANSNGELGIGDYEPRVAPAVIDSLRGKGVRYVACGGSYSIALG